MLYRCETCKAVTVFRTCESGHIPTQTRELSKDETDLYVKLGHEAFGDLVAVKDGRGRIQTYKAFNRQGKEIRVTVPTDD